MTYVTLPPKFLENIFRANVMKKSGIFAQISFGHFVIFLLLARYVPNVAYQRGVYEISVRSILRTARPATDDRRPASQCCHWENFKWPYLRESSIQEAMPHFCALIDL